MTKKLGKGFWRLLRTVQSPLRVEPASRLAGFAASITIATGGGEWLR